jgi:hypothetical protein
MLYHYITYEWLLCLNTEPSLILDLQQKGFSTPNSMRHLGIELAKTIEETVRETIQKIDMKAVKRRILATTPPTDILHRATLINAAMVPMYNHVLMALPVAEEDLNTLHKEILSFLWTQTNDSNTVQKRRLVATKRLPASFDKGGLQIQHPSETAEGLRLNLIQKSFKKITAGNGNMFTRILEEMLRRRRRPDLSTHINSLGPTEWNITGNKLMGKNHMVGLAFKSIATYLTKLESSPEDWHLAPIRGHTRNHKLFPFYPADYATLETHRVVTVSQIFETHLSGQIDKTTSPELLTSLAPYPALRHKLQVFTRAFSQQPFHNKYLVHEPFLLRL